MKVVEKGYLTYWHSDDDNLTVGIITKEFDEENPGYVYFVYVDRQRYNELAQYGLDPSYDDLISSVFLGNKDVRRFRDVPYFIQQRTADRRRCDIDEILKKRGLTQYNQFKLLLATEGKYPLDNWRVLRKPMNSITCDKE